MSRHTTFKFCLDPTVEQLAVLDRYAGAARFAFNQCLRIVETALNQRRADVAVEVPSSGFDLINAFNAWKKSEAAGRVFAVDTSGVTDLVGTGLVWRRQVCQQVFEEAAVDCGRALSAWSDSRRGKRKGKCVGFHRFKKKNASIGPFRLRNKQPKGRRPLIRVGEADRPRSVILPGIGTVAVHDDTRGLRRMLGKGRAKVLFATVSRRAGRWWVALNVEAAELHLARRHPARAGGDRGGWVGVDRGLSAFLVAATADGREVARVQDSPKALTRGLQQQRHLAKTLSRRKNGSVNRQRVAAHLGRHHHRVANIRRHFLHQVSGELVKTHDRLVLEDLNVAGMLANRRLARAISDVGWAEFARQLHYKQSWRGGAVKTADRWYPSSQLCSICGARNTHLTLSERAFTCPNGHRLDRDLNAAANLAAWAKAHEDHPRSPDPQAGGRAINARRREGAGQLLTCAGETGPNDAGTDVHAATAV